MCLFKLNDVIFGTADSELSELVEAHSPVAILLAEAGGPGFKFMVSLRRLEAT